MIERGEEDMRKTVGFGEDDFQTFIEENHFFIDKTLFTKRRSKTRIKEH